MTDTLITGAMVIAMDPGRRVIVDGAIAVRDGVIVDVDHSEAVIARHQRVANHVVLGGGVVIPGLVNGHTHGCMAYGRTLGYDQTFQAWLGQTQLPMMAAMTLVDYELAETLTFAENLLGGNTTVGENGFFPAALHVGGDADEVTVRAAASTGARLVLATSYLTQHADPLLLEAPAAAVDRLSSALTTWHRRGQVVVAPSLLLPWATDLATLERVRDLAAASGAMLHLHTAETPHYNAACVEWHGARSNVDFLHRADALGPSTQLIGCSELDETDLEVVAASGARIVSVPTANMFQSHRLVNVLALRDRGIEVSLASNGCAGNGGQSMFAAMKDGAGVTKSLSQRPDRFGKQDVLEMATIIAARNLGMDDLVGSIEIGKRADLTAVSLSGVHQSPVLNPTAALVYSSRGSDVTDVFVEGRHVVRDGALQTIDVPALVAEVQGRAASLIERLPSLKRYLH